MSPEERRVKAVELAIKAAAGYSSAYLSQYANDLLLTAHKFDQYIESGTK